MAVTVAATVERPELRGWLTIETRQDGELVDRQTSSNIVCVPGLTDLAAAVAWSGAQDQGASVGANAAFLTPLWGAIGTGTVSTITSSNPPATTDSTLMIELGRAVISAAAATTATPTLPSLAVWQFQFGIAPVTYTITEAGVFCIASVTANSGDLLDHAVFSPTVTWTAGQTLTLAAQIGFGPVA